MKPGLYVITDSGLSRGRSDEEVVRAAVRGGATVIQLREKNLARPALRELALRLLDICRTGGAAFIVNDDPELAADIGADGAHVGPDDPAPSEARRLLGPNAELGWSTKSSMELAGQAKSLGVSYVAAGSIFMTTTKAVTRGVGVDVIHQMKQASGLPVAAIGGINLDNVASVAKAGADYVCAISSVVASKDIEATCRRFNEIIEAARTDGS